LWRRRSSARWHRDHARSQVVGGGCCEGGCNYPVMIDKPCAIDFAFCLRVWRLWSLRDT
jgi:hypothetical protein